MYLNLLYYVYYDKKYFSATDIFVPKLNGMINIYSGLGRKENSEK